MSVALICVTRPRGARRGQVRDPMGIAAFQSTRPRGARRLALGASKASRDFNPRARVGRDDREKRTSAAFLFQSTRPRGARHKGNLFRISRRNFNPRARVGRDAAICDVLNQIPISIHAPAWGATCHRHRSPRRRRISIHAPAWGATYSFMTLPPRP